MTEVIGKKRSKFLNLDAIAADYKKFCEFGKEIIFEINFFLCSKNALNIGA